MSVPVANSLYTFFRQEDVTGDSQDESLYYEVVADIPGCTVYHSGSESVALGSRERVDARIMCDVPAVEIKSYDRIYDQVTGQWWYVAFVRSRLGFGLDHLVIGIYEVTGTARGTRDS